MSYKTIGPISANSVLGNPSGTAAEGVGVPLGEFMSFVNGSLSAGPRGGRDTVGDTTLLASDDGTSLVSTDAIPANYILPTGLRDGFIVRHYQGGLGKISYVAGTGATIRNGAVTSAGLFSSGYYSDLVHIGGDEWAILNNSSAGVTQWSIAGMPSIKEGDVCKFIITRPLAANGDSDGATITITGTGVDTAGLDRTLVEALTDLTLTNSNVEFDGVDELTIKPGCPNPLAISFFAVPSYTDVGSRDITLTISSPSIGTIATAAATTTVLNTSYIDSPAGLFPPVEATVAEEAASAQAEIEVADASRLMVLGTVTGDAAIPALTWIKSISGNTITLSANLTDTLAEDTVLTVTPPGIWLDFSTTDNLTMDGSNRVEEVVDLVNGYTLTQSTNNNKPVYVANSLNSLGGLQFTNGGNFSRLAVAVSGQVSKTLGASCPSGSLSCTLTDASGIVDGMHVTAATTAPRSVFGSATPLLVSGVDGNVVSFNQATTQSYSNGAALLFTPEGTNHPLINLLDAAGANYTIIAVYKNTSGASNAGLCFDHRSISVAPGESNAAPCTLVSMWDGVIRQSRISGMDIVVPCTVVNAPTTGKVITVDDATGVTVGMQVARQGFGFDPLVSSVPNLTTINMNMTKNLPAMAAGTVLQFRACSFGYHSPQPATKGWLSTGLSIGHHHYLGTTAMNGLLYEIILVPKCATSIEWRGLVNYLATKWGASTNYTTSGSTAAGSSFITLTSVTGLAAGQKITGTGIADNTFVIGVDTSGLRIRIDTPTTGVIAGGVTIARVSPAFKKPRMLDVNDYVPTFRDDFTEGLRMESGDTPGWLPYYAGGPGNPFSGSYNSSYSDAGHGSSNHIGQEKQWYLDVLNHQPWLPYNPYVTGTGVGAETGEMRIDCTPVAMNPEIQGLLGYSPSPGQTAYTATSGHCRTGPQYRADLGRFTAKGLFDQQYGYFEARLKTTRNGCSVWPAFWPVALDGYWPPEIDIFENNPRTSGPSNWGVNLHGNSNTSGTGNSDSPCSMFDLSTNPETNYTLYGVEVGPRTIDVYINREFKYSFETPWDFNTPWEIFLDHGIDTVTPPNVSSLHVGHVGVWRRQPQSPSVSSSTQVETTALLAAMTEAPSGPRQTAINAFIAGMKAFTTSFGQTLWDALDILIVPAAHHHQAARINWKNPSQVGTVVGSPVFEVDHGYTGSFGTSYIDTGINLTTFGVQLTAAHNMIGCAVQNITDTNATAARPTVGTTNFYFQPFSNSNSRYRLLGGFTPTLGDGVGKSMAASGDAIGRYAVTRWNYKTVVYKNGTYRIANAGAPNPQTLAFDNANILIANGDCQVSAFYCGPYWTPDDFEYFDALLKTYLEHTGAQ